MGCGISRFGAGNEAGREESGIRPKIELDHGHVSKSNNKNASIAEQTICDWNDLQQGRRRSVSSPPSSIELGKEKRSAGRGRWAVDIHEYNQYSNPKADGQEMMSTSDCELEEGGRLSGSFWISSPSFREYCVANYDSQDSVKAAADALIGNMDKEEKRDNPITLSTQSQHPHQAGSKCNNENYCRSPGGAAALKRGSGGGRRRREYLRKVLTAAHVKNLFSVTATSQHHTSGTTASSQPSKSTAFGKPLS